MKHNHTSTIVLVFAILLGVTSFFMGDTPATKADLMFNTGLILVWLVNLTNN